MVLTDEDCTALEAEYEQATGRKADSHWGLLIEWIIQTKGDAAARSYVGLTEVYEPYDDREDYARCSD